MLLFFIVDFSARVTLKFDGWPRKKIRVHLLYYIKLCASFQIHRWIQTEVRVWKRSIRVKIGDFLSRVTLKYDGWPWKTIGHLFYTTSSFVHNFIAISEFKLELQSGNAQFGSKWPKWHWTSRSLTPILNASLMLENVYHSYLVTTHFVIRTIYKAHFLWCSTLEPMIWPQGWVQMDLWHNRIYFISNNKAS